MGRIGHHSAYGNQVFARYLEKELRPWIEKARVLLKEAHDPNEVEPLSKASDRTR